MDPTIQDNVVIPSNFFQYIHQIGCAFNLHSIINSGLIPGSQSLSNRQTIFFLPVDPMDKNHKDPDTIDLEAQLFELLETESKTQCKACLSYWSEGIVFCTLRHLLKETVAIPEYVIKKRRPHGHRCGKLPEDKEYHLAHNLKKRCEKRDFKGIHDRFLREHVFCERMIQNNRDEEVCRAWDVLAEQDHTYHMSQEEYFHYKQNWWITLNKSGNDTQPVRKRSDFNQALSTLNRLHRETQDALLEIQTLETGIEFFLHLVAVERNLVVFLRIQRKSMKKMQAKTCDRTEQLVVYSTLAKTSDAVMNSIFYREIVYS